MARRSARRSPGNSRRAAVIPRLRLPAARGRARPRFVRVRTRAAIVGTARSFFVRLSAKQIGDGYTAVGELLHRVRQNLYFLHATLSAELLDEFHAAWVAKGDSS